jgi:hypothetical protein
MERMEGELPRTLRPAPLGSQVKLLLLSWRPNIFSIRTPGQPAQKIGTVETAAEFFKKRAGKAKGDGLMKYLRNAPRVVPEPEDQLR